MSLKIRHVIGKRRSSALTMAKRRRASTRNKSNTATEPGHPDVVHGGDAAVDGDADESGSDALETCPVCQSKPRAGNDQDQTWVMCEPCKTWYHASCVGFARKLDTVDKWCILSKHKPSRHSTY